MPAEVLGASARPPAGLRGSAGMAGRFEFSDGMLCFEPRFSFAAGLAYAVIDRCAPGTEPAATVVRPAGAALPSARVVEIYPSTSTVPLNLLRLYVHFSAPMSEGLAAQAVRVIDAGTGEPLADALLPMPPELWDRRHTRLTVLLDPGRIKRGLVPHTEAGYPLVDGMHVAITIDDTFLDADANPLAAAGRRDYRVVAAERRHVQPGHWTYRWPRARTRDPVTIDFDRPLDHALALRCLHITDPAAAIVAGTTSLDRGDTRWRFEPARDWLPAAYTLTIEPILEDPAGNSITRVFDRDLTRPDDDSLDAAPVTISFDCAEPSSQ